MEALILSRLGQAGGNNVSRRALLCALGALATPAFAGPTRFQLIPSRSSVTFSIVTLGIPVASGAFRAFGAQLDLDVAVPESARLDVQIAAHSVDTGDQARDEDLRSARFFDAARYPQVHFSATRIERRGARRARVSGYLTIRAVTRPLVLMTTLDGDAAQRAVRFDAHGRFRRSAFGMTEMSMFGDEVRLNVQAAFERA